MIIVHHNKTYTQKREKNLLRRVTTDQSPYNHKGFKGRLILDLHYWHCKKNNKSITKIQTRRNFLVLHYFHNKQTMISVTKHRDRMQTPKTK